MFWSCRDLYEENKLMDDQIITKIIMHYHITMKIRNMGCFHSNVALHFPHTPIFLPASGSQLPSHYSGGKPLFPITTRCIHMYFHSIGMAHTVYAHAHTHHRMVYIVFPIRSFISLLAWLQPQCLCYAMCFCQRSPVGWAVAQERQLKKPWWHTHASILALVPTTWWNITSIRPEGKNNKTGGTVMLPHARTHRKRHTVVTEGLLSCVSWLWAFLQDSFSFWFTSARIPAVLRDRCDHLLYEMCFELKWVVGTEWQSCESSESIHKFSVRTVKVQWDKADTGAWTCPVEMKTHAHTPALSCDLVPLCFMWPVAVCWGMSNRTTNGPDTPPGDNRLVPSLSVPLSHSLPLFILSLYFNVIILFLPLCLVCNYSLFLHRSLLLLIFLQ